MSVIDVKDSAPNRVNRAACNKDGSLRDIVSWNCNVLSTGEMPFEAFVKLIARQEVDTGALVRMLSICFPEFANFHGFEGEKASYHFVKHVEAMTNEHYGSFGRWWIQQLANNPTYAQTQFEDASARWTALTESSSSQGARVAVHFAEMEAALILASKKLDLTMEEIHAAMEEGYQIWSEEFSVEDGMPREHSELLHRVRSVLANTGKFPPCGIEDHHQLPAAGNWGYYSKDGIYYVLPSSFEKEICGNMDKRTACRVLHDHGFLDGRMRMQKGREIREWAWSCVRPHVNDNRIQAYQLKLPAENE